MREREGWSRLLVAQDVPAGSRLAAGAGPLQVVRIVPAAAGRTRLASRPVGTAQLRL